MHASYEGHLECVKNLLDKGSEVNMLKKVSGVLVDPFTLCENFYAVKLCVLVFR